MSEEGGIFDYKSNALNAVNFILVFDKVEWGGANARCKFKPEMAHQVFGEEETIFGYKNLTIDVYYMHNSSKCFLDIKYEQEISHYQPDNLVDLLNPWLPTNYTINKADFIKLAQNEKHNQTFGKVVHEFERTNQVLTSEDSVLCKYKITQCDIKDPLFQEYHQRFETFIVWYIDAANFIDLDDDRWLIYYIYEEYTDPSTNEQISTPIGFSSIYKFFSYPSNTRARIAQFFILPTHRKKGLGTELYKSIYNDISKMPDVVDMTVEEPSQIFQKLRDICDSCHIYNDLKVKNENLTKKPLKHLYNYMGSHKICKRQAVRISDILQYYNALKSGNGQVQSFSDLLLKRIQTDLERDLGLSKMARSMVETDESSRAGSSGNSELARAQFAIYISNIKEVADKLKTILD